jgi:diguanylate cyclase (GGDEF)-like protein
MSISKKIKQLEKEIKKLKELVYKDELTKLYNRRGFKEEAEKFISQIIASKKYQEKRKSFFIKNFSLIVFDIDDFKKLNDEYGHPAGDEGLKLFSNLILERVRNIDVVARWGGEEIIIGLVGASENDAYNIADDIREKLEKKELIYHRQKIKFTVSGGVASFEEAKDFDHLFDCTDKALYKAKRTGKNKIIKHSDL